MNPNPKTSVFVAEEESTGVAPAPETSAVVLVVLEGKVPTVLVDVVLELTGEPGNNGREVPTGERAGESAGIRGREEEGRGVEEEEGERTGTGLRGSKGCIGKTEEGEGAFRDGMAFGSGAVGDAFAVVVGRTFTSSFIPWLQCPGIPQIKYLNKMDQEFIIYT